MTDKQHITIHIADVGKLDLNIERDKEELIRKSEDAVNVLWSQWCAKYPDLDSKTVLAMVTFQYTRMYYELSERLEEEAHTLKAAEEALDKILLNVE